MAWRKPTLADIAATLSQRELDAYRQSSDFGGADPVESLLSRTAEMVRSYCRANGEAAVSPVAGEIPESLVSPAMDYAAYDILKRLPINIGEDRRKARDQAIDIFKAVASNDISPEPYDGDDPEAQTSGTPRFNTPTLTLD